ncbi:MAG: TonB-dependent receptor [Rhodothermaceae bacterium]|nr:TonB-dependent receptor [Rhodothermaceae bacterium]
MDPLNIPARSNLALVLARTRFLLLALLAVQSSAAQQLDSTAVDSLRFYELADVMVTATRGSDRLGDLAIPAEVLTQDDANARGATRLSDLLGEIGGYTTVHAFGTGVQVQGLGSDYTLILLDGEPVIGRTSGTLDLSRLALHDIERVEVIRGPFSSLYGSDALAGVINLISRTPTAPWQARASARIESHETTHTAVDLAMNQGGARAGLGFDGIRSGGYDLDLATPEPTTPRYTDYTANGHLAVPLTERLTWRVRGRLAQQDQREGVNVSLPPGSMPLTGLGLRTDWSAGSELEQRFASGSKVAVRLYTSRFRTETELGSVDDLLQSRFDQDYSKGEIQLDALLGTKHLVTVGGGAILEAVEADRLRGARRTSSNLFAFVQEQWLASRLFELTASARFDAHSDYARRLSPMLAALVKPHERLRLRASLGSGFKAPTFQQRYLDFTNAPAGYSVYGATDLLASLDELEAQGLVSRYESTFTSGVALRPERSFSVNAGAEGAPFDGLQVSANLFHNTVSDLIEIAPVAELTNGRQVYSYFNLDRVQTQGLELGATVSPFSALSLTARYQYLDAVDLDALEAVEAGTIYRREAGRDRPVRPSEYGGLFQRSRHSGSLELRGILARPDLTVSLRGTVRTRYGDYDRNGNLVLDDASEYVAGHALVHVTLTHGLTDWLTLQAGVTNLFDYTNPARMPSQPGRLWFGGLRLTTAAD